MGFLVKLDTNGTKSVVLEKMIAEKAVDFFAMDIKTSLLSYKEIVSPTSLVGFPTSDVGETGGRSEKIQRDNPKLRLALRVPDHGGKRETYGGNF